MIILDEKYDEGPGEDLLARGATAARKGSADSSASSKHLQPPPYAGSSSSVSNGSMSSISLLSPGSPSSPYSACSSMTQLPIAGVHHPVSRSNNLYITRSSGSIKGKWIIDTDLHLPLAMLPQIPEGSTRKNLLLHTDAGRISVHVEVKASRGGRERARFELKADPGCIKLRLRREGPGAPPLSVSCECEQSNITIHLPHDYRGAIRTRSSSGEVLMSHCILKDSYIVNREDNDVVYYIGSNTPSPDDNWDDSDGMDLIAPQGWIKLLYLDEPPSEEVHSFNDIADNIKIYGMKNSVSKLVNDGWDKMAKFTIPGYVGYK